MYIKSNKPLLQECRLWIQVRSMWKSCNCAHLLILHGSYTCMHLWTIRSYLGHLRIIHVNMYILYKCTLHNIYEFAKCNLLRRLNRTIQIHITFWMDIPSQSGELFLYISNCSALGFACYVTVTNIFSSILWALQKSYFQFFNT